MILLLKHLLRIQKISTSQQRKCCFFQQAGFMNLTLQSTAYTSHSDGPQGPAGSPHRSMHQSPPGWGAQGHRGHPAVTRSHSCHAGLTAATQRLQLPPSGYSSHAGSQLPPGSHSCPGICSELAPNGSAPQMLNFGCVVMQLTIFKIMVCIKAFEREKYMPGKALRFEN